MEQPKDYEVQTFEEALEEAYVSMTFYEKVVYFLQDYILPALFAALAVGYLAGVYFGK